MNVNATAVANYFVDISNEKKVDLTQFGLMKRVYIAYGFCLAILDKSILDLRFDVVEAWKYGPVIPSVYHSFKHNKGNAIKNKSVVVIYENKEYRFETPTLQDEAVKAVVEAVWDKYEEFEDAKLIDMLHQKGTPWYLCYEEGMNNRIPENYTAMYYKKLLKEVE